jgi:phage shock protein PspC (stress-responsive transcriptional regulator)
MVTNFNPMKETIKINLAGQLFDLDHDAYERLKHYLDSLEIKFGTTGDEGSEIIEDIEARIAEILQQKIDSKKQVISLEDVEEIIGLMGEPEQMEDNEDNGEEPESKGKQGFVKGTRRFYRDPQNRVFGGVCSGLAAYFNIDPIWIRLLFVFLFFAKLAGVLIYVILWIIMPPAKTTGQRLEMQGKSINLNDIEDSVKREFEKVKTSVKNIPKSKGFRNAENSASEILESLGNVLLVLLKVLGVIVIVSILVALVISFISFIAGGIQLAPWHIFHNWHWPHWHWNLHWPEFTFLNLCIFLVIAIPVFALIGKIFRWLFNIQSTNNFAKGIGATIWVLAFISLVFMVVAEKDNRLFREVNRSEYTLPLQDEKPLYVGIKNASIEDRSLEHYQIFNFRFSRDENDDEYLRNPEITIVKSYTDAVEIKIEKSYALFHIGRIPESPDRMIDYSWHHNDSSLLLSKFYMCDEDDAWRLPNVSIEVKIPEGKTVYFDDEILSLFDIELTENVAYTMRNGGLKELMN